jgi:AP endonuclease-2
LADDPNALDSEGRVVDPAALDAEGRCVVLEFPAFVIFGVYSPANSNGMRDNFRYNFICTLDARIRNLRKMGKNVILTGDLNVSREEIDTARAEEAIREEGITRAEYLSTPNRRIFNQLLENGRVIGPRDEGREEPVLWDICREFHPKRQGMYTHWEQKINARPGNFGSRIDYVLCSSVISSWFQDSNIQEGLMGSDHCPVYATTKDIVDWRGEEVHIVDILNPPGMFKDGKRLRDYDAAKDPRPTSGKLMTEFNKRRSIKDMFAKKPTLATSKTSSATNTISPEPNKDMSAMEPTLAASKTSSAANTTLSELNKGTGTVYSGGMASSHPFEEEHTTTKTAVPMNPVTSPEKRRASATSPAKSMKRTKSNIGNGNSQSSSKGQKTLTGFFAAKPSAPKPEAGSSTIPSPPTSAPEDSQTSTTFDQSQTTYSQTSTDTMPEPFIDPEASKEGWARLFSGKPPPRCEHGEPCKSFKVKKAGPNCGREFWLCARPLGPTGQKERGTQWRCPTYIWASDWKGSDVA